MAKFHLTPKGQARQCSAQTPESCRYSQEAGEVVAHYDTKEEAQKAYETEKRKETFARILKKDEERRMKSEANWPTPSKDRLAEYEQKGYEVDPDLKGLRKQDKKGNLNLNYTTTLGMVNAQYSINNSIFNTISYESNSYSSGKLSFSDYGTNMNYKEAHKHLYDIESAMKNSNKFINQMNKVISDSEKLYGHSKDNLSKNRYAQENNIDNSLHNDVELVKFEKSARNFGSVKTVHSYFGNDFNASIEENKDGSVTTKINMKSLNTKDPEEFKDRIYELRNILSTIEHFDKDAE